MKNVVHIFLLVSLSVLTFHKINDVKLTWTVVVKTCTPQKMSQLFNESDRDHKTESRGSSNMFSVGSSYTFSSKYFRARASLSNRKSVEQGEALFYERVRSIIEKLDARCSTQH